MGLDQYAYKVKKGHITSPVDFTFTSFNASSGEWEQIIPESEYVEIAYWRKHHDLHGWMQKLYNEKGGLDSQFNCNKLLLTIEDLADLEYEVKNNSLPSATGFFFGHDNTEYYKDETLSFIENARNAINEEYDIVYDSWW